jgi:hypothetical protein
MAPRQRGRGAFRLAAYREAIKMRDVVAEERWTQEVIKHYSLFHSVNLLHRPPTLPPDAVVFSSELLDGPNLYPPCMLPRGADGKVLPGFPTPEALRFAVKTFAKSAPQLLQRLDAGDILMADKLTRLTIFKLPGFERHLAALGDEDLAGKHDDLCYIFCRAAAVRIARTEEPPDVCVACMEKESTVSMTTCNHQVFCPGCRRKVVARVLGVPKRRLNAKELDRTRVCCPLCRRESTTTRRRASESPGSGLREARGDVKASMK